MASQGMFSEVVDVPEWAAKIQVRSISYMDRVRLAKQHTKDGDVDVEGMMPALFHLACYDPDTEQPVFASKKEALQLMEHSGSGPLDRLMEVAMRLSGFTAGGDEEKKEPSS